MTGQQSLPEIAPQPEFSPKAKRVSFWLGLLVVWLFVLGYFQFGLLDRWAVPASERVNDGVQPSFFAVHINPYYLFSEDFHLYVVRSKRILDRGWTDSPLCHAPHEARSYCAPLQAALMMLAVRTEGRPIPYALFMVSVLMIAWTVLYVAASKWAWHAISPLTILAAVLLTIFFESIPFLLHWDSEYGQWPVHRGLRLATLAWTSPVVLSVFLAALSLLFHREKAAGRLCFVSIAMVVLSAADTWAFLLSAANICVVLGIGGTIVVFNRKRLIDGARPWLVVGAGLALAVALGLIVNRMTGSGVSADALTRAGFGVPWRDSAGGVGGTRGYVRGVRKDAAIMLGLVLISALVVRFRPWLARRTIEFQVAWQIPSLSRLYLLSLAIIPMLGWILLVGALSRVGMEIYHASQFSWRRDYILLFAFLLVAFEAASGLFWPMIRDARRWRIIEIVSSAALLFSLFAYHNVRIHHFVRNVAAREFFLTRDEEELRDWLKRREPALGNYTLATASHELNYLCAYWTNADLLLPEGFPYHGSWSQSELEAQMARVLATYRASPERWLEFNLHRHVADQWSWAVSRELSARHGYMYYLLHRALMVKVASLPVTNTPKATTAFWAERRLSDGDSGRSTPVREYQQEGFEACQRIADCLREHPSLAPDEQPDVILVDGVSRFLGTPDLANYSREFQYGDIEAWVKRSSSKVADLAKTVR